MTITSGSSKIEVYKKVRSGVQANSRPPDTAQRYSEYINDKINIW